MIIYSLCRAIIYIFCAIASLCNFKEWRNKFLTFIKNLQQLTQAKAWTTQAAAPGCSASPGHEYIHLHLNMIV
jgi:hypothetical protein